MNVINTLAEEAYSECGDIGQVSPEEWMAVFLAKFSDLIIHEAASVANITVENAGGDGQEVFDRIKQHFEVIEHVVEETKEA